MRSGAEVDASLVGNQLEPVVKFSMGRGGRDEREQSGRNGTASQSHHPPGFSPS